MASEIITVVTGLPRSGTSMMMKMLEAGGIPVLTDGIRTADEDNPEGYYEFEPVKKIEQDKGWLFDARGKAVKMIAALLKHLPRDYEYEIIFMRRDLGEVLASQHRMLVHRGEASGAVEDDRMAELFNRHLARVTGWIAKQSNMVVLQVDYAEVLDDAPQQAQRISEFSSHRLDAEAMASVVNRGLYRQRR